MCSVKKLISLGAQINIVNKVPIDTNHVHVVDRHFHVEWKHAIECSNTEEILLNHRTIGE